MTRHPVLLAGVLLLSVLLSGCGDGPVGTEGPAGSRGPAEGAVVEPGEAGTQVPSGPSARDGAASAPRRVLFLSADSLRADHTSLHGYARDTTPHLRRLAEGGVVYTRAQAQAPWTRPSYASMFTSRWNADLVVDNVLDGRVDAERLAALEPMQNPTGIPDRAPTLATLLRDADVALEAFGLAENPNLDDDWNFHRGFHDWDSQAGWSAGEVASRAAARLAELAAADASFLVFVHFQQTHYPYRLEPPYDTLFSEGLAPFDDELLTKVLTSHGGVLAEHPELAGGEARQRLREAMVARYDAAIVAVDAAVGRLLDALDELGLADDTMVVFNADHGEEFDDHGSWGHAHTLFQELLHVPLVVRWPARSGVAPRTVETPVANVDVVPTILTALGVDVPDAMVGRDLRPDRLGGRRTPVVSAVGPQAAGRRPARVAVLGERYKLVRRFPGGDLGRSQEIVFDLARDPGEQHPLRGTEPSEVARLRAWLDGWLEPRWDALAGLEAAAGPGASIDPETVARLRELGYLGEEDG